MTKGQNFTDGGNKPKPDANSNKEESPIGFRFSVVDGKAQEVTKYGDWDSFRLSDQQLFSLAVLLIECADWTETEHLTDADIELLRRQFFELMTKADR